MQGGNNGVNFVNTVFVAAGLSVDACAVALAYGLSRRAGQARGALVVGATFGAMSGLMPLAGALAAGSASRLFSRFDHWIAFGVLAALGIKSLLEARKSSSAAARELGGFLQLLVAALAISVDTLAAGFSFELLQEPVAPLALFTAAITGGGSAASFLAARKLGTRFQRAGMVVGGLILLAIAFNILREHADHLVLSRISSILRVS